MDINIDLSELDIYKNKTCVRCGRKYPETVLNIEGVIHHALGEYKCIDIKSCKRAKRKI